MVDPFGRRIWILVLQRRSTLMIRHSYACSCFCNKTFREYDGSHHDMTIQNGVLLNGRMLLMKLKSPRPFRPHSALLTKNMIILDSHSLHKQLAIVCAQWLHDG